jgi:hypothetical protein
MAQVDFCAVAFEVRSALDEGRIPDAKRIAAEHLRTGYTSQQFLEVVAEILEIEKEVGVVGRKQQKQRPYWVEIGNAVQDLRDAGATYENACAETAKKFNCSESTIKNTVRFFKEAESK